MPEKLREHILSEIASRSGVDGIELATSLAKVDSSAAVQFAVFESLQFRRAKRLATELLKAAGEGVWHLVAEKGYADEIEDPEAAARVKRERQAKTAELDPARRIRLLLHSGDAPEAGPEVATLIQTDRFPVLDNEARWVLEKAFERYPRDVASALLRRLEAGQDIPFDCGKLLRDLDPVESGPIVDMVVDPSEKSRLVEPALAVVVGPKTLGRLIDQALALHGRWRRPDGTRDETVSEEYFRTTGRIANGRVDAFLVALYERSQTSDPARIAVLADMLARHGKHDGESQSLNAPPEMLARTRRSVLGGSSRNRALGR
jgi:hypothetical protein